MQRIVVNTRVLNSPLTGVQRYVQELLGRFGSEIGQVSPVEKLDGVKGHLWEQMALPFQVRGRLLWSPSNTGPLTVRNQVLTLHDVVPLDHPEWLNSQFAAWYRFLVPKLVKRVKHVITISEFSRQRIQETTGLDPARISVIPNAVDARFCPRPIHEVEDMRTALGIPTKHYVLSLGSLEPRKNLKRLLQAWNRLSTTLPDDVWLVVAGGKGKALVFQDVFFDELPPRVYFTGHVSDEYLPAIYSGSLAFVYPSVYEGMGLPPLEAMASGAVPVTGNLTALPEVMGDAGIMVDPYSVEAISEAIRLLVVNDRVRLDLRFKGLERAKTFTWEKAAASTWRVLSQAAERDY